MAEPTEIDFDSLTYRKPEIDQKLVDERTYTDSQTALKIDNSEVGGNNGIMKLTNGKVPSLNLDFATSQDASEATSTTLIMNPLLVRQELNTAANLYVPLSDSGAVGGYAPLDFQTKIDPIYLPATQNVDTYVVETIAERNALVGIIQGDRAIVTSEGDTNLNGEYVAEIDDPTSNDWALLPNLSTVGSVQGRTGDVVIIASDIPEIATNTSDISTNAVNIQTNANNIATNTSDISDNTDAIALNTAHASNTNNPHSVAIANLSDTDMTTVPPVAGNVQKFDGVKWVPFSPAYEFTKVVNHTVTNDVYETVGTLNTTVLPAATYEVKLSMTYSLNSTNSSAYFRFSLAPTGDSPIWNEFRREPKDNTDKISKYYAFPFVQTVETGMTLQVEVRKENANNTFEIDFLDLIYEWKKD